MTNTELLIERILKTGLKIHDNGDQWRIQWKVTGCEGRKALMQRERYGSYWDVYWEYGPKDGRGIDFVTSMTVKKILNAESITIRYSNDDYFLWIYPTSEGGEELLSSLGPYFVLYHDKTLPQCIEQNPKFALWVEKYEQLKREHRS